MARPYSLKSSNPKKSKKLNENKVFTKKRRINMKDVEYLDDSYLNDSAVSHVSFAYEEEPGGDY